MPPRQSWRRRSAGRPTFTSRGLNSPVCGAEWRKWQQVSTFLLSRLCYGPHVQCYPHLYCFSSPLAVAPRHTAQTAGKAYSQVQLEGKAEVIKGDHFSQICVQQPRRRNLSLGFTILFIYTFLTARNVRYVLMCCREGYGNARKGGDAKCGHQKICFAVRTA
jgi:hypothetical protein